MIGEIDCLVRMALALVLGGIIGYQRESRNKSAGLRTHVLVCLGSCLIMLLSINVYYSVEGKTNADPARLAAQVVSGIGFLGAGTIMKEGLTVKGLTTAASLWVVSGVGLAVGCGYFVSASAATAMIFLTLTFMSRLEKLCRIHSLNLVIKTVNLPGQIGKICTCLGEMNIVIKDIKIEGKSEGFISLLITLDQMGGVETNKIVAALINISGIIGVQAE